MCFFLVSYVDDVIYMYCAKYDIHSNYVFIL